MQTAQGMPWMLPEGLEAGVFMSPCASNQTSPILSPRRWCHELTAATVPMAIEIASSGTAGFHLTFDLDGTDPQVAPGVGTPVQGGTTLRESHLIMEHAAESEKLLGLELTEINPILDNQNATARFAVDLILSALGKAVL